MQGNGHAVVNEMCAPRHHSLHTLAAAAHTDLELPELKAVYLNTTRKAHLADLRYGDAVVHPQEVLLADVHDA